MIAPVIDIDGLITAFTRNAGYFHTHLDGLTHADALVQPPVPGNCILWITGHILHYHNNILRALLQPPALDVMLAARFAKGSQPVLADEPGLARLETLTAAYDDSQSIIFAGLRALTYEQAREVITQGDFTMPRAELVMSYMRHESYHLGQLELLREIALHTRR
jgi:hypothetical protein